MRAVRKFQVLLQGRLTASSQVLSTFQLVAGLRLWSFLPTVCFPKSVVPGRVGRSLMFNVRHR